MKDSVPALLELLTCRDWERAEIVPLDAWWADGCWRLRSSKPPVPVELYLTFLVDPQWDRGHTNEPPAIWAIAATEGIPESRTPAGEIALVPLASRKLRPRIDALVEELDAYREERHALADVRAPWTTEGVPPGLAAELAKELAREHPLYGAKARAIARRGDCDDVLFVVRGERRRYAVVHLTWASKPEPDGWPAFELYDSLAQWRQERMLPDRAAWTAD